MLPRLGGSRSATTRRKVDLPQPEGPSKVRNSPCATSRSRLLMAVTSRRSVKKRTPMSRQAMAGAAERTADIARQPFMARTAAVAFSASSEIRSSTFGVRAVNWPSSA